MASLIVLVTITTALSQFINLSPRIVYAHTFSTDESADFLSLIYRIKNEAQLVQSNLMVNSTDNNSGRALAQQHADNAITILNQTWTKEIAERNHRVASELTTALIGLKNATTSVKPAPMYNDIQDKVTNLTNLLGEALSVRLTKDQISNSTIQALALVNIINKIDRRYSNPFGVGYNDMSPAAMNMGAGGGASMSNTAAALSNNNMPNDMNMMSMIKK